MTTEHKSKFTVISNQSVDRTNIVKEGYIGQNVKWAPKCVLEHDYPNVRNSLEEYEKTLAADNPLKKIIKEI